MHGIRIKKVHSRVHKIPILVRSPIQVNPVHIPILKINSNVILQSTPLLTEVVMYVNLEFEERQ
jgi:hypothetical protein